MTPPTMPNPAGRVLRHLPGGDEIPVRWALVAASVALGDAPQYLAAVHPASPVVDLATHRVRQALAAVDDALDLFDEAFPPPPEPEGLF